MRECTHLKYKNIIKVINKSDSVVMAIMYGAPTGTYVVVEKKIMGEYFFPNLLLFLAKPLLSTDKL